MNSDFETYLYFKGIGNPNGKLWFFGLEEGGVETEESIQKAFSKINMHPFLIPPDEVQANKTQVWSYISKLSILLLNLQCDWRTYRERMLSEDNSEIFLSELYPLPKRNLRKRPEQYKDLFNLKREDRPDYIMRVREEHFPNLYHFWQEHNPAITICYGKSGWNEYMEVLKLTAEKYEAFENGKILSFRNGRILLVPFLGNGQISHYLLNLLIQIVRRYNPDYCSDLAI